MKTWLTILPALFTPALGHTIFTQLWVNGVGQGALNGIRYPTYDGPITDVTSESFGWRINERNAN
jgi:cellulase